MWTALHVLWSVAAKRLIRLGRLDGFDGDISYAVPPMTADRTGQYVSYPGIIGCYLRGINVLKPRINPALSNCKCLFTGGIHEKGSGEVVSSVCYTIYIHCLSIPLHKNSWDDISRTLFMNSPVNKHLQFEKLREHVIVFEFPNWWDSWAIFWIPQFGILDFLVT